MWRPLPEDPAPPHRPAPGPARGSFSTMYCFPPLAAAALRRPLQAAAPAVVSVERERAGGRASEASLHAVEMTQMNVRSLNQSKTNGSLSLPPAASDSSDRINTNQRLFHVCPPEPPGLRQDGEQFHCPAPCRSRSPPKHLPSTSTARHPPPHPLTGECAPCLQATSQSSELFLFSFASDV